MDGYNEIIEKNITRLRQQYDFGNYWGRSLFNFVEKLKLVIQLQHLYYVEYQAVTKRLINLKLIESERKKLLDEIISSNNGLEKLT